MSAGTCDRCEGREFKNLSAHTARMHPEASWLRADDPKPHPLAYRITIESGLDYGLHDVTSGEWRQEPYGFFCYGWFIPVEVPPFVAPATSLEEDA